MFKKITDKCFKNAEIFDSPEEYFTILLWGVFTPDYSKEFLSLKKVDEIKFKNDYEKMISSFPEDFLDVILDDLVTEYSRELSRRKTIEDKAASMLSSNSLSITLLTALVGFFSKFTSLNIYFKLFLVLFYTLPVINIISSGLHARNVLGLRYYYHVLDIKNDILVKYKYNLNIKNYKRKKIVEIAFITASNSYLNSVKASFLKFSHWYYKATFVTLFPLFIFFFMYILFFENGVTKNVEFEEIKNELNITNLKIKGLKNILISNEINKLRAKSIINTKSSKIKK